MKDRWGALYFEQGFGKLTKDGVWHVGKSELHFEPLLDSDGNATGTFEGIVRNKLSFKGTQTPEHKTHYQELRTGLFFRKEGKQFVSVNIV